MSNANEDFPEPEGPVITINLFFLISTLTFFRLCCLAPLIDKIFFVNSGAEANEGAIKLARKFGKKNLNGAYEIITATYSFHGRTLATWAATGKPHVEDPFHPLPTGFIHVEYNNIEAVQKATTENTTAIMIEPVQGEGGVNIPTKAYLQAVRKWCDKKGILLIVVKVQLWP